MMNDIIEATILNVKFKGENVLLPCIPMILTDMSFEFKHLQYPVRLAFPMTINKAQGHHYKCVDYIWKIHASHMDNCM
jgi:ATP-dependent DNA helicase PIF1